MANMRAKFEFSSLNRSRDMEEVAKFSRYHHDPIWPDFAFFYLVPPVAILCAKFQVSTFTRFRDMEGVPKL